MITFIIDSLLFNPFQPSVVFQIATIICFALQIMPQAELCFYYLIFRTLSSLVVLKLCFFVFFVFFARDMIF